MGLSVPTLRSGQTYGCLVDGEACGNYGVSDRERAVVFRRGINSGRTHRVTLRIMYHFMELMTSREYW